MSDQPLNAFIIGCGRIAGLNEGDPFRESPCTHAGAYLKNEKFTLVGVADSQLEKAKSFAEKFSIKNFYSDFVEGLKATSPEVISVCVPYRYNLHIIEQILENYRPKSIFLEKPIAIDAKTGEQILRLCNQKEVSLYVSNRKLTSYSQTAKSIIDTSELPITITGWCTSGLNVIGIHMVDLVRHLFGEIAWVYSSEEQQKVKSLPYSTNFDPSDISAHSLIGFKNGKTGTLINTALSDYSHFEIEVLMKNSRLRIVENGKKIFHSKMLNPEGSTLSYKLGQDELLDWESKPMFMNILDHIWLNKNSTSPLSGLQGLQSLRCIEAMKYSAEVQKRIDLIEGIEL